MDPTLFAVLSRRMESVARTMQHTLVRASRSGVIANGHDCSCCILSADAELLSIAQTIPIHVMSGADEMARTMQRFHPELRRGDAFLHNSPYHGCTHAADLSILVPVFDDAGRHRFTAMTKAHQADIGNARPTTYMADAQDVYEEGALIFPAVRIQSQYRIVADVVRMGRARIRAPDQWYGDLLALIGAARAGEAGLCAIAAELGWGTIDSFASEWLSYSESRMAQEIAALPAGRATGESCHDAFPRTPQDGIPVRADVEIDPDAMRIVVDLQDNLDCLPCGLNLSEASARSAALIGVFNGIGKDIPANSGSVRRVEVLLRDGCVVGIPTPTTSCSVATTNLADRVVNAVQIAMASLGEHFGMAEAGAIEGPAGAVISGTDARHGHRPFINQLALAGTAGAASPHADGWLTMGNACTAGMWTMDSVEIDELSYPIRIDERRLVIDSEGPGTMRGAPACRVIYQPVDAPMRIHYACDGKFNPARGVRGGGTGGGTGQSLLRLNDEQIELPPLGDLIVQPGEQVIAYTSAGGGYGPPAKRSIEAVSLDVREGYVSTGRAREVYRVVCDEHGVVDRKRTAELRRQIGPGGT